MIDEERVMKIVNFKLKDSERRALVKCPKCHAENYAITVSPTKRCIKCGEFYG